MYNQISMCISHSEKKKSRINLSLEFDGNAEEKKKNISLNKLPLVLKSFKTILFLHKIFPDERNNSESKNKNK